MTQSLSDSVRQAKEDASIFIKIGSNEEKRLHIVSKPRAFGNIYFEKEPFTGAPKSMNVPFGTTIPGYKVRPQWAFEVVDLESGKHKILCAGIGVTGDIDKAEKANRPKNKKAEEGAGYPVIDIILSKTGEKLSTEWTVTNAATEYEGDGQAVIDMDKEIVMTSADLLAKLGRAAKPASQLREGVTPSLSVAQVGEIDRLAAKVELTLDGLNGIISRNFGKHAVSELTQSEASALIGTLSEM